MSAMFRFILTIAALLNTFEHVAPAICPHSCLNGGSCQFEYQLFANTNYPGNDLSSNPDTPFAQCRVMCDANPKCIMYVTRTDSGIGCFLKNATGSTLNTTARQSYKKLQAVCFCPSGWTGSQCETPICSQSCANGATCIAPETCNCRPGWTGTHCSAFTCSAGLCSNGGTCSGPNTCSCEQGWLGPMCQQSACAGCDGNCTKNGGKHECSSGCISGYTGSDCNTPMCKQGCGQGHCISPGLCSCPGGSLSSTCPKVTRKANDWNLYNDCPLRCARSTAMVAGCLPACT